MKTFNEYVKEATNIMRFLKNNKNLDNEQIDKLNTFFTKTNRKAGAKID